MNKKYIPMRKGYFFLISILALLWTGCSYESSDGISPTNGRLTVKLEIEEIDTGIESATRASIPAETDITTQRGEKTIDDLYLLFYDYQSYGAADESGGWVKTVGPIAAQPMNDPQYVVTYDAAPDPVTGKQLVEGNEYVILAIANLEGYLPGDEAVSDFLDRMAILTEKEALEQTQLVVQGVGTNETGTYFDQQKIDPAQLPMSARTVVSEGASDATVKLTRGVSRFDVEIPSSTGYQLVSASIWGAAANTMLWDETDVNATERLQRFYGLKKDNFITKDDATGTYRGGLYAFENYVAAPQPADVETTCVILGLAKTSTPANVTYYRVNVNLSGAPQNLVRNHVYRIKVNSVSGPGEKTEYNAWKQIETKLSFTINDWNIDEGGLVKTDGINTLILPTKRVVLDPEGESWYQTVFTKGNSTLRISRNSFKGVDEYGEDGLPVSGGDGIDDIHIFLDNNTLRVEAQPIRDGKERRGTIELSYAGLSGTITFVQAAEESTFLMLDRYEIPNFLPLGRGGISDNSPLQVTASGPWTATIYNTSEDPYNPGFSFSTTTNPVTVLRSVENPYRNLFTIYTTGDNPKGNAARNGFVIVTLDEDPENYQRVVVLTQVGSPGIALTPDQPEDETLRFSGMGVPQGISSPAKETGFVFTVDAGRENGAPRDWTVTMTTGGANFQVIKGDENPDNSLDLPQNQFRIVALTSNLGSTPITGTVTIQIVGSDITRTISLSQGTIGLSLSASGTEVPKVGGRIAGVSVNIDASLTWEAEIVENYTEHEGYLWDGTNKVTSLTGQSSTAKLVAGFDKIYYPLVNKSPQMKIKVTMRRGAEIGGSTTLTVTQEALTPRRVKIQDVRNTHYGSLTTAQYFKFYRSYLGNSPLFGSINSRSPMPAGSEMQGIPRDDRYLPSTIPTDYTYLHAGGVAGEYSTARHQVVYNWWKNFGKDEGILVFVNDQTSTPFFANSPVMQEINVSSAGNGSGGSNVRLATDQSSSVHDYLLKGRGPFGEVNGLDRTLYNDGISSTAVTAGSKAVPILSDGAGKTILFIDPFNNVVFIGEAQVFDIWMHEPGVLAGTNGGSYPNNSKFLGNLLAYIVNSAQYGSHFSDLFRDKDLYDQQTALESWTDPYSKD